MRDSIPANVAGAGIQCDSTFWRWESPDLGGLGGVWIELVYDIAWR